MDTVSILTEDECHDLSIVLEEQNIFDFDVKKNPNIRIHNIQASREKEAEHGLMFVPTVVFDHPTYRVNTPLLFEILDGRDSHEVLKAVQDIVQERKIENSLDVFGIQNILKTNKDMLNLTIAKLTVYGSSHPKNVTSPNGKPDWNIGGGFFVETNRAFYSVPGYGTLRQLKQTLAALDLSNNSDGSTGWHHGEDALRMAVKDPEILRAYHVYRQEIHKDYDKLSKSLDKVNQEASKFAPQALYRNSLPEAGGTFAEADLSYDPKRQSPRYIKEYFAKCEVPITEQQFVQLTVADFMGVVSPYEVVGMVRGFEYNSAIIDEVLGYYPQMIETVRQQNKSFSLVRGDEYDLQSISSVSISGSNLIESGHIGPRNKTKFVTYDHKGDQHINQYDINDFARAVDMVQKKEQVRSR